MTKKKSGSLQKHEENTMLVSVCSCDLEEKYLYKNK